MVGWYNISMSTDNDGSIEEQSKFFEEALKCFDKALEIDPNDTYAWVSKGLAFFNKNDYDQALGSILASICAVPSSFQKKHTYYWI